MMKNKRTILNAVNGSKETMEAQLITEPSTVTRPSVRFEVIRRSLDGKLLCQNCRCELYPISFEFRPVFSANEVVFRVRGICKTCGALQELLAP
jgi:hypothetical protein